MKYYIYLIGGVLLLIFTISYPSYAAVGLSFNGDFQIADQYQDLTTLSPPGSPYNDLGGNLDLKLTVNGGEKDNAVAYLRYNYPFSASSSSNPGSLSIYQAYLNLTLNENGYIRVGRQLISWGSGYFWNPTNYLGADKNRSDIENINNPFDNWGVDVVNYQQNWGDFGGTLLLKPQENDWNQWGRALKFDCHVWNSDLAFSAYQLDDERAFGVDYATSIGNCTVYCEMASKTGTWWYISNNTQCYRDSSQWFLDGVVGFDWNLGDNWTWIGEYFYNQQGWNSQETINYYNYIDALPPYANKGALIASVGSLFAEINNSYLDLYIKKEEILDNVDLIENIIFNCVDNSCQLSSGVDYQFEQNSLLELIFNDNWGTSQSEMGTTGDAIILRITNYF